MGNWFSSPAQQVLDACAKNKLAVLERIANANPELNVDAISDPKDGFTPLMLASRFGHLEIAKFLIHRLGAKVNLRHLAHGTTALHLAAGANQVDLINFLLDSGADALLLTSKGLTVVDYARLNNQANAVRALERRCAVYSGYLKMRRSTKIQSALGRVLGSNTKEMLVSVMGGELRDCWIVMTNTFALVPHSYCPHCQPAQLLRLLPGSRRCAQCFREIISPDVLTEVREVAVYASPFDARPDACYTFARMPNSALLVEDSSDVSLILVPVLRNPTQRLAQEMISSVKSKHPLWRQVSLTLLSPPSEYKKLAFFRMTNVNLFIQCLKSPALSVLELTNKPVAAPVATTTTTLNSSPQRAAAAAATSAAAPPVPPRANPTLPSADEWTIPPHFLCPISKQVMDDPVVTCDGQSFDRASIERHFSTSKTGSSACTSPLTGLPLDNATLVPNLVLRRAIEEWKNTLPVATLAQV